MFKYLFLITLTIIFSQKNYALTLTAQDLLKKYDEIMAPNAFEIKFELRSEKDDGTSKNYEIHGLKSGDDKFRLWFDAPASIKNQEILRNGNNFWLYLPNVNRSTRIANRESFQGGDFNNADILKPNYSNDFNAEFEKSANPNDYQLMLTAKGKDTSYDKIKLWFNRSDSMPIKGEYYATSGKILRSTIFSEVKKFGENYSRPAVVTMKNEIIQGRKSILKIISLNINSKISEDKFNINSLGN